MGHVGLNDNLKKMDEILAELDRKAELDALTLKMMDEVLAVLESRSNPATTGKEGVVGGDGELLLLLLS